MFVRWKNRTLANRNAAGLKERSLYAVIVKNQRVEGRTKQKVIKYLAHINESDILRPEHQEYFWQRVDQGLTSLELPTEERAEIESKLVNVVARPMVEERDIRWSHVTRMGAWYEPSSVPAIREHRSPITIA